MKDINSNTCSITAQDAMLGQINKMMRTFVVQAEAFEKLKRGGNQNIKVDHISRTHRRSSHSWKRSSSYAGGGNTNDSKRKNESEARRATWQQKRPKAWVLQPRKYPNTKRFGRNE